MTKTGNDFFISDGLLVNDVPKIRNQLYRFPPEVGRTSKLPDRDPNRPRNDPKKHAFLTQKETSRALNAIFRGIEEHISNFRDRVTTASPPQGGPDTRARERFCALFFWRSTCCLQPCMPFLFVILC